MHSYQYLAVREQGDNTVCHFQRAFLCNGSYLDQLARELSQVVEETPNASVVVSFRGVEFVCSTAFGKLVALYSLAKSQGIKLILTDIPASIRECFAVTQLDRLLDIRDELTEVGKSSS